MQLKESTTVSASRNMGPDLHAHAQLYLSFQDACDCQLSSVPLLMPGRKLSRPSKVTYRSPMLVPNQKGLTFGVNKLGEKAFQDLPCKRASDLDQRHLET